MKRATVLFLLAVLSLVAMQPTIALHFCGGHLRSVTLGHTTKSCCGNMAMENSCCATCTIEIAVDDFQLPQPLTVEKQREIPQPPLICDTPLTGNDTFISTIISQYFPPGNLAFFHADRLTWICIFRI